MESIRKYMATPRNITNDTLEEQASIMTLHFIGYIAKPIGIPEELYKECLSAFNNHRGKVEWEEESVLKVLQNYKGDHP